MSSQVARALQVPYFLPQIGEEEIRAVTEVLRSGWLTTGPVARQFEQAFSQFVHARFSVAVNSCTSGLHAALLALGISPGDEVITTPLTFCSTVRVIEEAGATPVFVDIGPDLNIDPRAIESKITERTRAIIPVHIAGLPCDMPAIHLLAHRYGLKIVEDAAHAFGAALGEHPIGSDAASATVFSFYANKNLIAGEGGMITTADASFADRVRRVSTFGIERGGVTGDSRSQYEVVERGFKYNLSDVLAAVGLVQLGKASAYAARRKAIAHRYHHAFQDLDEIELPATCEHGRHAWHLYIIRLQLDAITANRDEFAAELHRRGIGTSIHFKPIPMHRYFAHYGRMQNWPAAQREYPRLLSLPIYPAMTDAQQEYVIEQVSQVVMQHRKEQFSLAAAAR